MNEHKRLIAQGRIPLNAGSVSQVDIAHDPWCRIYKGKRCNCDADIRVTWSFEAGSHN